jgi:hypothetical protein
LNGKGFGDRHEDVCLNTIELLTGINVARRDVRELSNRKYFQKIGRLVSTEQQAMRAYGLKL